MARRMINELKWHPGKSLSGVTITYVHRGAPNDLMSVRAEEIVSLEKSFFIIKRNNNEVAIPYHRIVELRGKNGIIWRKK